MHDITEADWKVFKRLHAIALDRFCARVLAKIASLSNQADKTNHERYGEIYGAIHDENKDMASAFDGLSRSRAYLQTVLVARWKLLTAEELSQFSPEFQERLQRSLEF